MLAPFENTARERGFTGDFGALLRGAVKLAGRDSTSEDELLAVAIRVSFLLERRPEMAEDAFLVFAVSEDPHPFEPSESEEDAK